jgi:Kef-type K+ transport system membrane component KefB
MPIDLDSASNNRNRVLIGYCLAIAASIGVFLAIRAYGIGLEAPPVEPPAVKQATGVAGVSHPLLHVLLTMVAVILLGRALAMVMRFLGQPPVIGEVLAGICLGPSLLGQLAPGAVELLMPPSITPSLSVVAQLGVIFYMFLVGLELNGGILRKQGHVVVAISHGSIIVPFVLGAALAIWLYPMLSNSGVAFTAFALFLSVSMSVTAFPVLARILTDRQLSKTDLGVTALACAATDDISAWCLLALVVGVAQSEPQAAMGVIALALLYLAFILWMVRPWIVAALARSKAERVTPTVMTLALVGVLVSALATEAIGIHAIFGAFLLGAVIPHDSTLARELVQKQWLVCLVIILVATVGKFGGTLATARLMGLGWREASSLGVLMNTRGLMELVVLNIGLDLGVISPTLFAMMVVMALATTMATSPVLRWLVPDLARVSGVADRQPDPIGMA